MNIFVTHKAKYIQRQIRKYSLSTAKKCFYIYKINVLRGNKKHTLSICPHSKVSCAFLYKESVRYINIILLFRVIKLLDKYFIAQNSNLAAVQTHAHDVNMSLMMTWNFLLDNYTKWPSIKFYIKRYNRRMN